MWTTRQERLYSPKIILEFVCQENVSSALQPGISGNPMAARLSPVTLQNTTARSSPLPPLSQVGMHCRSWFHAMEWHQLPPAGIWPPVPIHMVAETQSARFWENSAAWVKNWAQSTIENLAPVCLPKTGVDLLQKWHWFSLKFLSVWVCDRA